MSEELKRIEQLEEEIRKLKGLNKDGIPTFIFSRIRDKDIKKLVNIKRNLIDNNIFDKWFLYKYNILEEDIDFLKDLISKNISLINLYKEEDLKLHFLGPIFNKINFKSIENNFRDFYDEKLTYKTDKFILNGEADFIFSQGLEVAEKPYFFIQEFKKAEEFSNPRPQLLAELISAVELNNELSMRGAFIVGAIWNFVILEKLGKDKYQYFVSINFDSTKIEDLKGIYKNLIFVKNEIIEIVTKENKE
jgi:hypothetical protein